MIRSIRLPALLAAAALTLPSCAELPLMPAESASVSPAGLASAGNLIANGGFEQPVVARGGYQLFATGQSFPGWEVIGARGNVAPISGAYQKNGIAFNARSGAQWLDMTGLSNNATGVQQTVRTRPGQRYALTFYVGNVSGRGFGTTSAIELFVAGKSVGSFRNDTVIAGAQHWRAMRFSFTATTNATSIAFLNRDVASDQSNGLDDVSLVESPGGTALRKP